MENNDAGNAFKTSNGKTIITHCLINKCTEINVAAESSVSIRNPTNLNIEYSNFTNNLAQNAQGKSYGSPSVECTGEKKDSIMKFSHIEDGKGYHGVSLWYGDILYTNVIRFEGHYIFIECGSIIECCLFGNKAVESYYDVNNFVNCFTDDDKINRTTTSTTQIGLINNARWSVTEFAITCANKSNIHSSIDILFAFFIIL